MSKISRVIEMLRVDDSLIRDSLTDVKRHLDSEITEIDVRLCIDFDSDGDPNWIIRSGDSSYDPRHSNLCGAGGIAADSDVTAVLEDLIDQCLDQCAESDSA